MPYGRHRRRGRGFTLVEILVVVAVLGLAAAMIVPRLSNTGDQQAAAAARTVLADLQYAQNEAIITQKPVTVAFDGAAMSYTLSNADGVLKHPVNKYDYAVRLPQMPGFEKVVLGGASFGGYQSITFDSMGAPDSGGQVFINADGAAWVIRVAAVTGRISIEALN